MHHNGEYTFVCPGCEESITVNESMKTAMIDRGCVLCGSGVSSEAFTSN